MVTQSPLGSRVAARSLLFGGVKDRGSLYRINVSGGPRNTPLVAAVWHCGPRAPHKALRATAETLLRVAGADSHECQMLAPLVARRRLKGCNGTTFKLKAADLLEFVRAFRRREANTLSKIPQANAPPFGT